MMTCAPFARASGAHLRKASAYEVVISPPVLAIFASSVGYGVKGVGGCRKILFGGEGLFMTELRGPGWVMLQSLKKLPTAGRGRQ